MKIFFEGKEIKESQMKKIYRSTYDYIHGRTFEEYLERLKRKGILIIR